MERNLINSSLDGAADVRRLDFPSLSTTIHTCVNADTAPFLKWPGGKRWLAPRLAAFIRQRLTGKYFEPFLGSGAIFFALRPQHAMLSDINDDLINVYIQVRNRPETLIKKLKLLTVDRETYYRIRSTQSDCPVECAVRFLYLNRTAFAGMYRLNQRGQFNVPFGGGDRTPKPLWNRNILKIASTALRNRKITAGDFSGAFNAAAPGDVIYCDPTYTVTHNCNGFIRYNEKNFSWEDQERLAHAAFNARAHGVLVIISNAAHESIAKLYSPVTPLVLKRNSLVSPDVTYRTKIQEFLFILDPTDVE